ncbi:MAG TPA: polysaccharide biosynthesis C-terminal domain-containing protein, partial [Bacteroidia bacterium]
FFFSHSVEKDARKVYAGVMNYFVIICMVIFLVTMMNISWIQYFVGRDYRTGLDVVPILLLANFCLGVFFNLSIWYKLTGKTKFGAWLTIFGAVVTLLGNFIFIPMYGYMASAWATLVCYAGMMVVSYFIGNKYYPVSYDMKRFLGYLGLSLALYVLSLQFVISSHVLNLAAKNSLLLLFLIIVFIFERKNLLNTKNAGQNN